ncbi:unnamed protein product [Hapterophycus canaliculatus]
MKAADYRIPWGRPSEHLLAVKREIVGQQLHVRRVQDARNRSTINTDPPECAHMPHLITRPKKKKMQEDRQREIAAENYSLMHRLASIMKEERGDPVQKFAHLSVEYRESLRRKKLLKLETENRRLARSIRKQKPFYPNRVMEREEEERQALLKTMSRTERRKERVASLRAMISGPTKNNNSHADDADITNAGLVENGVLFRPGPTPVKLRTARQMQLEVARRRHVVGAEDNQQQDFFTSGSRDGNGSGGEDPDGTGGGGGARGSLSSPTSSHSLAIKRRGYSDGSAGAVAGLAGGIFLEVNRTGGGDSRRRRHSCGSGGRRAGHRRSATGGGRPNMIFTPSLAPVGMESVRACPMSLGGAHASMGMAGEAADPPGRNLPGGLGREDEPEASRDVRTV